MVYELDGIIKNKSNTAISKYIIKDSNGLTREMTSREIKALIIAGKRINGLKIKNNRLIRTHVVSQSQSNKGKNFRALSGDTLHRYISDHIALSLNKRDMVYGILNFCSEPKSSRVLIVHGIRRTGKTVSILQSISELIHRGVDRNNIVYIAITGNNVTLGDIVDYIESHNQEYIFIDEITRVADFYDNAAIISDILAVSRYIVLTGTDSFVFPAVTKTNLYGRAQVIHSTLIPYKEYIRLFNINTADAVDVYKNDGGMLLRSEFSSDPIIYQTLKSVVLENIKNSIRCGIKYDDVLNMITEEQALYLIFNYIFMITQTKDAGSLISDRKKPTQRIINILHNISGLSLDVKDYNVYNLPKGASKAMLLAMCELDVIGVINNIAQNENGVERQNDCEIISFIQALARETLNYNSNIGKQIGFSFENMIIANTIMWARGCADDLHVGFAKYKYDKEQREVDIVVYKNTSNGRIGIPIEIKHKNEKENSDALHLKHESIEKVIGSIVRRIVVYRGKTIKDNGVLFINAHDYLTNLDTWLKLV